MSKKSNFEMRGTCTALVTPFTGSGAVDYAAFEKLLNKQIDAGIKNYLVLGSTGEHFAVNEKERDEIMDFVRSFLPKNCKMIVNVGSNSAKNTINEIVNCKNHGADACLVQPPYFTKCSQEGLYRHFSYIAERSPLPLILYNIPSRAGVNIEPETMLKLCNNENIIGIKEANGNIEHILKMFNLLGGKTQIFCGNDNLYLLFLSLKASGTISVCSNVFPLLVDIMFKRPSRRLAIHQKLFEFNRLLFVESNPVPVKYALYKLGIIENILRPPLLPLSKASCTMMDRCLKELGE